MSREDVFSALKSTGIPWAHMAWPKGKAPDLPWGVYRAEEPGFAADDTTELYTKSYDPALVKAVEEAIAPWGKHSKTEAWIDEENCLVTYFEFTEIGE